MRVSITLSAVVALAAALAMDVTVPAQVQAAGTISGTVSFTGDAPARRTLKMAADPACDAANPSGRLGEVMVVKDGKLANVFVYIKEGLGDQAFETPKAPVVLDQVGCMYTPRVIGAQVGQTIEIRNSDATLHNVHSLPKNSKQFNQAMPIKDSKIKKKFTAAEVMIRIKCDVHPWMAAYVGVLEHPFFAVSSEDGSFSIANVPAGTYTVEAWHERLGVKSGSVTVADDGSATVDFSFAPAAN